ncbi:MAG: hypothetical protein AAGM38_07060 [Pseudomonadota bacterium]
MIIDLTSQLLLLLGAGLFATLCVDLLVAFRRRLGAAFVIVVKAALTLGLGGEWAAALRDLAIDAALWLLRRFRR